MKILILFIISAFLCSTDNHALPVHDIIYCPGPRPVSGPSRYTPIQRATSAGSYLSFSSLLDCGGGLLEGVWDATGGLVSDITKCVGSIIQCASRVRETAGQLRKFFAEISTEINKMSKALSQLPSNDARDLVCTLAGTIGADIAITVLTAGTGSAKLAASIAMFTAKLTRIIAIIKNYAGLPIKLIAELSENTLKKLDEIVRMGYGDDIKRSLTQCGI